jgi:cysteine-rich repeat protein
VEDGWDCTGEPSQCVLLCGNTTLDSGEECDGALLGGMTCATVPGGFTDGTLTCASDCRFDTSGCSTCGNNVPEPGEECDDGNTTAGDGCSPTCQHEALPVLYFATGDPAVWGQMTITYAGDPHAPQAPIVAAANADQRGYAYVFTATTYHQLSLPGHQWIGHGSLNARFPGVPGSQLTEAIAVSWPADTTTNIALVTSTTIAAEVYMYGEDNTTGSVTPDPANPGILDWSGDPLAPASTAGRAAFQTLSNANGWTHHDVYSLCSGIEPTTPPGADVGPYVGIITTSDQLHLYNCSWCWLFYDQMPTSQFTPFTEPGAPATAGIVAAFYSTDHGNRLYVVIQP